MLKRVVPILIVLILLLTGCMAASPTSSSNMGAPSSNNFEEDAYRGDKGGFSPAGEPVSSPGGVGMVDTNVERLVIQNANLTILVATPGEAMSTVRRMAEEMGGFVVASNLYKTYAGDAGELPEATITVRVPAGRLNEAIDRIKALTSDPANDVKAENISGQDVTKEYTDLRSRLRNLEETEAQLREILGSATKTEDVLAVYRELTAIREQIEVIKGQIQYYEEASAMSSVAVLIKAKSSAQPIEIGGWQPAGVARESIQALVRAMQTLANVGITFVLFVLPLGLIIALPFLLAWLIFRRSRKKFASEM
jgi:archaellum component FlaC